jgi:hypothetical protein
MFSSRLGHHLTWSRVYLSKFLWSSTRNQRAHALDLLRMDPDVLLIGQFVFENIANRTQIGTIGRHHFLPILDKRIIVLGLCHCQGKNETNEYD